MFVIFIPQLNIQYPPRCLKFASYPNITNDYFRLFLNLEILCLAECLFINIILIYFLILRLQFKYKTFAFPFLSQLFILQSPLSLKCIVFFTDCYYIHICSVWLIKHGCMFPRLTVWHWQQTYVFLIIIERILKV